MSEATSAVIHDGAHACSRCVEAGLRVATTDAERARVYQFRYRVYVKELGRGQAVADHDRGELRDEMDATARILYAEQDDQITGTVRWNRLSDAPVPPQWREWYQLHRFDFLPPFVLSVTSRLMVASEHRGSRLALRLALATYQDGLHSNIQLNFIHTSTELAAFFERLGYRKLGNAILDPNAGERHPMYLALHHVEHLKGMRSPFADHCAAYLSRLRALSSGPSLTGGIAA